MPDPYDEIPYFALPHWETHPDRLEVAARLMGLTPAPTATARILEIGCADGGNLVPLAAQLPLAELVGVDSSQVQVELAHEWIAAADLHNVEIVHARLEELDASIGTFDYVIAHGVYSWITTEVRDAFLALVKRCLRPHGVAYVSYNVMPGWHLRSAIRDMMLYHVADDTDGLTACNHARELVRLLADGSPAGTPYAELMKQEARRLETTRPSYFFHDHLSPSNHAWYFHEFVAQLAQADLAFLAEALLSSMMTDRFDAPTQQALAALGTDIVRSEQYMDFLTNRSFRRSLVVHADAPIDRNVGPGRLHNMWAAAPVRWSGPIDMREGESVRFTGHTDGHFFANTGLIKALWYELGSAWPGSVPVAQLVARACRGAGVKVNQETAGQCLQALLSLYGRDFIELLPRDRSVQATVSDRPAACPVARVMAQRDLGFVTTRLQKRVAITNFDRDLLLLLDGTRSVDAIIDTIAKLETNLITSPHAAAYRGPDTPERRRDLAVALIVPALTAFAQSGLLIG